MNVILSFLSVINTKKEEFENGDGTKNVRFCVSKANYEELKEDQLGDTETTNESGLRYVLQKLKNIGNNEKLDAYIALESNAFRNAKVNGMDLTHKQYFENRANQIFAADYYKEFALDTSVVKYISYNEDGSQNDSISTISAAINKINELRGSQKVNLYLDVTGGLRDASMVLLIISRILEHEDDISVIDVIYSKYDKVSSNGSIDSLKEVYALLDLLAGVEEFVKYGRADIIREQFKNYNNPVVIDLLEAMTNFSKKILVCHYGEFKKSIRQLYNALENFKEAMLQAESKQVTLAQKGIVQIFINITNQIERKYGRLFKNDMESADYDLILIEWCYENGYLQQVMTLINERLPNYLFRAVNPILKYLTYPIGITNFNKDPLAGGKVFEKLEDFNDEELAKFYYWVITGDGLGHAPEYNDLKCDLNNKLRNVICSECDCNYVEVNFKREVKTLIAKRLCVDNIDAQYNNWVNVDEIIENIKDFKLNKIDLGRSCRVGLLDASKTIGKNLRELFPDKAEKTVYEVLKPYRNDPASEKTKNLKLEYISPIFKDASEKIAESVRSDASLADIADLEALIKKLKKKIDDSKKTLNKEIKNAKLKDVVDDIDFVKLAGVEVRRKEDDYSNYYYVKNMFTDKNPKLETECNQETVLNILLNYFKIKCERNAANHAHEGDEDNSYDSIRDIVDTLLNDVKKCR